MTWHGKIARSLLTPLLLLAQTAPVAALTGDEFQLRSGADVVALCAAPATDRLYTAADDGQAGR